jgi:NADPH2:quinone reductase
VLVEVACAGVNFIDIYQRQGVYPRDLPFVPGSEGVGRIAAVGEGVDRLQVGDRVAWHGAPGSYAHWVLAPAAELLPVPDDIGDEHAAALPLQGLTAHYLATSSYAIRPGDTVLVHAGAGGVGLLLTRIAKILGAVVLTTVSSPAKAEASLAAGADQVLGYEDFPERVRELTAGEGVHAVYDGVGASTYERSLQSLRRRGSLVLYGGASGQVPPIDPQRLAQGGSLTLTRPTLRDFVADRQELEQRFGQLLQWYSGNGLRPHIHRSYPLSEAAAAHRDLADRATIGKLLLVPSGG